MEDNESSLEWRVNKHKHLLAPSPGTFSFSFIDIVMIERTEIPFFPPTSYPFFIQDLSVYPVCDLCYQGKYYGMFRYNLEVRFCRFTTGCILRNAP